MDILDKMVSIMVGAIVVGALITEVLDSIINITLPAGLSSFQVFFSLIIPLLIVFGIVKYFKKLGETE